MQIRFRCEIPAYKKLSFTDSGKRELTMVELRRYMKTQYYLYKYGGCKFKKRLVLHKGEIKVHRFGVTIITGKNGTGKSTLLKKMYSVSNNAGTFVAQENEEIFEKLSPLENITFMQSELLEDKAKALISRYELDGILEKDSQTLSGGEKRIISLLRGIVSEDEIIFMDEPTNDLDFRIVEILKNIIQDYKNEKTFIIVTHDERLLSIATTIYKIDNKELKIEDNQREFEEKIVYEKKLKKVTNNKSFVKKVLPLDICNYLSAIFVTIISVCFFFNVMNTMNYSIDRINENQIEICNTLYKSSEELMRKGYIPTYMISFINEDMSVSELQEKIQEDMSDSEKELYSLSLDIMATNNYDVYTLKLFDLQEGIEYSVLDVYMQNILNKDIEKYYLDTSSYFSVDDSNERNNKEAIIFNEKLYQEAVDWICQQSEVELEKSFIAIRLSDSFDFEQFIEDKELADVWDANYFIRSNETIFLVETAVRLAGYKSIMKTWIYVLAALLVVTIINTVLYIRTLKQPVKILANYSIEKMEILKAVDNRCVNKKWLAIVMLSAECIMCGMIILRQSEWDVREFVIPVMYIVIMIAIHVLQRFLLKKQIGKTYRVEGEFEC